MRALLRLLFFGQSLLALNIGDLAPPFVAKNQDGQQKSLADYKGKFVLVYFYPKDDTPGCTIEALNFRDKFPKFNEAHAIILGVSTQDEASHKMFKGKHGIPFDLLVDKDGKLAKTFGVGLMPVV